VTERLLSLKEIVGLACVVLLPWALLSLPGFLTGKLNEVMWAFLPITGTALTGAILIGLPSILLLNWFRLLGLGSYVLLGVLGSIPLAGYFVAPGIAKADLALGWPSFAAQYLILLILSVLVTSIYWFAVRPDRLRGSAEKQ
jgi:hypothetical protein